MKQSTTVEIIAREVARKVELHLLSATTSETGRVTVLWPLQGMLDYTMSLTTCPAMSLSKHRELHETLHSVNNKQLILYLMINLAM